MADKILWEPPTVISPEEVLNFNHEVLALPDNPVRVREDIFRIHVLEMDWDIGVMIYQPQHGDRIPVGPDGKKVGVFLLHGGVSDFKSVERIARTLPSKFGIKVATMTFPGRFYFSDPSRDWPGDVEYDDGSARTPLWSKENRITQDQYTIVQDTSKREDYGTLVSLSAKEGTQFFYRMAAWPAAFEEAVKETARRHFPDSEFSIYIHGHSTGGPLAMMASQRVANIAGLLGYGSSPFGWMYPLVSGDDWEFPFNQLRLRTWRDTARYMYEGMKDKGIGLPMLIELTFERWETAKKRPNFKAEDFIHKNSTKALEAAARISASRLKLSHQETDALVQKYLGYSPRAFRPRSQTSTEFSLDPRHERRYRDLAALPTSIAALCETRSSAESNARLPRRRSSLLELDRRQHPQGIVPAVAKLWHDAIMNGFFER